MQFGLTRGLSIHFWFQEATCIGHPGSGDLMKGKAEKSPKMLREDFVGMCVLGFEPLALCMLDKPSTAEFNPQL